MDSLAAVPDEILTTICRETMEEGSSLTSFSLTSTHNREVAMDTAKTEAARRLRERNLGIFYRSESDKVVIKGSSSRSILKGDVLVDIHNGHLSHEVKIVVPHRSRKLIYFWCDDNTRDDNWEVALYGKRAEVSCWSKFKAEITVQGDLGLGEFRKDEVEIEGEMIWFPFFIGNSERERVANEELAIVRKAIEKF